ncbi:hypothetical protein EJ02DRAFT_229732 [Clathrospora elynae]|uniref:Uncharacterized protein n=1 Tax=Clathrospora elynae TaxID=706981 RepID=A0A6A5SLA7_9PLEO|nr:hypothetical protein EJ02DRAFT_229732 [Clathrospora elynae]
MFATCGMFTASSIFATYGMFATCGMFRCLGYVGTRVPSIYRALTPIVNTSRFSPMFLTWSH